MTARSTNPHHGYLPEPAWFTARAVVRELTCLDTWLRLACIGAFVFVVIIFG